MTFELNYIEWIAHDESEGWVKLESVTDCHRLVKSIGYVLKETLSSVTIAASVSGDYYCAPLTIPKSSIKKRSITRESIP